MSRNGSAPSASLSSLSGGSAIAAIMSGIGPKPTLAPPDLAGAAAAAAGTTGAAAGVDKGAAGAGAGDKGSAAGGSSGGSDGKAAGADAAAAASAGAAYRPAGLPDHLYGAKNEETIDKLFTAVDGFRKIEGDRGAVPKDPAGYGFQPSDKLKPFAQNFDKDPLFGKTREIALGAGITDKQFQNFVAPLLEHMIDGGMVDKPVDANAQLLTLAPAGTYANDKEKGTAAAKRVNDNIAWADGAKAQKTFGDQSDAIADFLAAGAASDPRAHHLVEWLKAQSEGGGPNLNPGGGGAAGGFTAAGYDALLAEGNKLTAGSPEYKAWQSRKSEYAKKLWGEGPAA
jgi:hypothetical protein